MPRKLTSGSTLESLRREAKRWLRQLRDGSRDARERLERTWAQAPALPTLRDVQHALARELGQPGWAALKALLSRETPRQRYERVAQSLVTAYHGDDPAAFRLVWDYFGHVRAPAAMRRYVRLDLGKTESPAVGETDTITLDEARYLVARFQRFESWEALMHFATGVSPSDVDVVPKAVTMIADENWESPNVAAISRDWTEAIELVVTRELRGLHAQGQMTDAVLARLGGLRSLTVLELDGSRQLTDAGIANLAGLPQLKRLNLAGCPVTDRGLAVLRHLPALESLVLSWTPVTDAGAVHLAGCTRLRELDLGGTRMGDGAIRVLANLPGLADLRTGEEMTDAGLALLQHLPVFREWRGGEGVMGLTSPSARPNHLQLHGSFTDAGMRHLSALEGLYALDVGSDRLRLTGAGLRPLAACPHLEWLSFDARDESMADIAALPHLRFLMCQDTSAGDAGFEALSRSRTIEHIWGRRCHNLRSRGFAALARMPALAHLSVSCRNVGDDGLAALPSFPALRELMPMDVPDEGYRFVGRCELLESLVLMYCRDTGDRATEYITGLPRLKTYFASYNRITDRTPELLSGIRTLEEVTFDSCAGVTDTGIAHLRRLPLLRRVSAESMPGVTRAVLGMFPPGVEVRWST